MQFKIIFFFFITSSLWGQSVLVLGKDIPLIHSNEKIHVKYEQNIDSVKFEDFSLIFIFSTASTLLEKKQEDSLFNYLFNGGHLYVGSENAPFFAEGNQLLKSIYNFESYGDFVSDTLEIDKASSFNLQSEKILSGNSTVSFPLDYRLKVEAWSNDNPIILSGTIGKGKIIIDGGYSRFYNAEGSLKLLDEIIDFFLEKD